MLQAPHESRQYHRPHSVLEAPSAPSAAPLALRHPAVPGEMTWQGVSAEVECGGWGDAAKKQ